MQYEKTCPAGSLGKGHGNLFNCMHINVFAANQDANSCDASTARREEPPSNDDQRRGWWNREVDHYSSNYQWLPANLAFQGDGSVKLTSCINNLHPNKYPEIYRTIEKLVDSALPLWDQCLSSGEGESRSVRYPLPTRTSPLDCTIQLIANCPKSGLLRLLPARRDWLHIGSQGPHALGVDRMHDCLTLHVLPPSRCRDSACRSALLSRQHQLRSFKSLDRTHLNSRTPNIRVRLSNLIRTCRILHNNRVRHRVRNRRPSHREITHIIRPSNSHPRHPRRPCRTIRRGDLPSRISVATGRTRRIGTRGIKPPSHRRLSALAHICKFMHSRKRRISGKRREEIVPLERVEGIADAEIRDAPERRVHGARAVGVGCFKGPLHADVAIFRERQLRGAAAKVEGFEGAGRGAGFAGVLPGCGLAL